MRGFQKYIGIALGCIIVGCSTNSDLFQPYHVERQHEAGSIHFAVLAVAPWTEYVKAMQPQFELSELEAIDAVVPTTRTLEESILNILQATASGSGPIKLKSKVQEQTSGETSQTTKTEGTESTTGESGETAETKSTTEQTTEGTEKKTTTATESRTLDPTTQRPSNQLAVSQLNISPPGGPGRLARERDIGLDPMLQYWAAAALYQEVQLLNRYVRDAAIRDGFIPYVLRLQVSLMPTARNEPYDAYCTMSFFSTEAQSEVAGTPTTQLRELGDLTKKTDLPARNRQTPQILPLMVTDNLEATVHSRMIDNIRQVAGAIFFMSGGISGSADVQQFSQELRSVLGHDLNSLLTVARVSDNTLRVRLGAMQQAASNFTMVPRNHNITVLLMVPQEVTSPTIQAIAKTTMVDAETGEALPEKSPEVLEMQFKGLLEKYELPGAGTQDLERLVGLAQKNDQKRFMAELKRLAGQNQNVLALAGSLWLDLISLMIGSQYSATEFDLPRLAPPDGETNAFFPDQETLVMDDTLIRSTAVLRGARVFDASILSAVLYLKRDGRDFPIPVENIEVHENSREAIFWFPSLYVWGLHEDAKTAGSLRLMIIGPDKTQEFEAGYLAKPIPEAANK